LLPDDTVLVAGGSGGGDLNSAEVYDPATGAWTATGNLNRGRYDHTATLLPDDTVLVAGGRSDYISYLNSVEMYDPATGAWTATGSLDTDRGGHTATLLLDDTVLVAGGTDTGYEGMNTCKLYADEKTAYDHTKAQLESGVHFRSEEVQHLDPDACEANPTDPNACSFSVTGMNDYVTFDEGRLYWRFCADYDEAYVGRYDTPHDTDDPGNALQLDPHGRCPRWQDLTTAQKQRRVSDGDLGSGAADICNTMIDARQTFADLALNAPADLRLPGVDELTEQADGTFTRGPDGKNDLVRNLALVRMLDVTRELANVHLVFGNEFLVQATLQLKKDALSGQDLIGAEQKYLERARRQFELAMNEFFYATDFVLPDGSHLVDHFTPREFQTFSAASDKLVIALTEYAKRERLLGRDPAAAALVSQTFSQQYLQALAVASHQERQDFLQNGGWEILNNLERLVQMSQAIQDGTSPFGYEETFVPLATFEDLKELTESLFASAEDAEDDLIASQREFDQRADLLQDELDDLKSSFETELLALCGPSADDYDTCTGGLMEANFHDVAIANNEVSLAWQRAENIAELIAIEEQRAGQVIRVTLGTGQEISAAQLAIGKLNAYRETHTVATSTSETFHAGVEASVTAAARVEASASGNPIGCVVGGCGVETTVSLETAIEAAGGFNWESSHVDSAEETWDPNAEAIAGYESLQILKEAERDAQIEGANSNAYIKQLLLQQSELLAEYEIAVAQFNKVVAEHNQLVEQYRLLMAQHQEAMGSIVDDYLEMPFFRLERDDAALRAADTLDRAVQYAYLQAKALEYFQLSPVSYLSDLYWMRSTPDLRKFLDRLDTDYIPLDPNLFSKKESRLSIAYHILGLTDENLNPDGTLSPAQVEQLRYQRFQAFLQSSHIVNDELGVDKYAIPFTTYLDMENGPFFIGASHYRISRWNSSDPGCSTGCRGVWLNLVTDQPGSDFGGLPALRLTHGGHATYKNGAGDIVTYDPGPAAIIGQNLPEGFGHEVRSILKDAHLNLPPASEPDQNLCVNGFYNFSIATSQWVIEIDMNETGNAALDMSQLKDIEVRMDATYMTLGLSSQYVEMENHRLDAVAAGLPVPAKVSDYLQATKQEQAEARRAAQLAAPQMPQALQVVPGDAYFGTMFVDDPVNLGVMDIGFTLSFEDGTTSGELCADCTPLYTPEISPTVSGTYDAGANTFSFTSVFTQTTSGKEVTRTLTFEGEIKDSGELLEGSYTETIEGYTAQPIVTDGTFLVSQLSREEIRSDRWQIYLPIILRGAAP